MPARKIPKNYRNVTGIGHYRKAVGEAAFESTLERDFLCLLEFEPSVAAFEVQPVTIPWEDEHGKAHRYTPDVLVHFEAKAACSVFYEVKYSAELRQEGVHLRPKFNAASKYARSHGRQFKIVTERRIRTPLLENARFLLPFMGQTPSLEHVEQLLIGLQAQVGRTPAELLQAASPDVWDQATLLPALWYLVAQRLVGADLHKKLTMESLLWPLPKQL